MNKFYSKYINSRQQKLVANCDAVDCVGMNNYNEYTIHCTARTENKYSD